MSALQENLDPDIDRTIEHAKTGHATVQQVIPFIDTKTGVLLTYSFAALLGPFWLMQAIFGADCMSASKLQTNYQHNHSCFIVVAGVVSISVISWALCVYACLQSVSPRRPPPNLEKRHLILFPYIAISEIPQVKIRYNKLSAGLSDNEILGEYEVQLLRIGLICHQKIYWHRFACHAFMAQLLFPMLLHLGILTFILCRKSSKFLGKPIKWTFKKAWDAVRWLPPFRS